jgi:hypothetical protein
VLCDVRQRSLCRADHWSRGVLPNVVCVNVVKNPGQLGLGHTVLYCIVFYLLCVHQIHTRQIHTYINTHIHMHAYIHTHTHARAHTRFISPQLLLQTAGHKTCHKKTGQSTTCSRHQNKQCNNIIIIIIMVK